MSKAGSSRNQSLPPSPKHLPSALDSQHCPCAPAALCGTMSPLSSAEVDTEQRGNTAWCFEASDGLLYCMLRFVSH